LAFAEAERCTLFMATLAAWKALLARLTDRDDVCVGTVVTGRTHLATEEIVGNFVNALALRTSLQGAPSFRALLARVRETVLGAFANQEQPFDQLVEVLRPSREAGPQPYFQIVFGLENLPSRAQSPEGLRIETSSESSETTKYDLVLWIRQGRDALVASLGYRTQRFDRSTVERLGRHYLGMLAAALAEPDRPIGELVFESEADAAAAAEAARLRKEASARRLKKLRPKP
jgi:non-ribosomal peptide synthetase component F